MRPEIVSREQRLAAPATRRPREAAAGNDGGARRGRMRGGRLVAAAAGLAASLAASAPAAAGETDAASSGYADVDGLRMYYEVRGTGRPLVVLHGGFMTIDAMGPLIPKLAETRQVVAVELEGHGRTADLDRPLRIDQMAADVAALIETLGLGPTDVFGFSMGGMTALGLAIERPELVRKLVVVSALYDLEGFYPSVRAGWPDVSADSMAGTPMEEAYLSTAPDPDRWPVFIDKMMDMLTTFPGWSEAELRSIEAPTLLVLGDADAIRPEHTVALFRLLGGAPEHGGMGPLPASQLAVLPGTTHFEMVYRTELLVPLVTGFLDAAGPPAPGPVMRSGAEPASKEN